MDVKLQYKDFTNRLKLLVSKHPDLITTTLSNIFSMRIIGNKTHGDLAEIAIAEFVNQYMYDFHSIHVGKDKFRAKEHEEDIIITNEMTKTEFPVSLKAYGNEYLQLSTDKESRMFSRLEQEKGDIVGQENVRKIFDDPAFSEFSKINVLPLIYNEKKMLCNILVFDDGRATQRICRISRINPGGRRKYPIYLFKDDDDDYVCEVRYGSVAANALQRGLWTHTKHGLKYFESITNGWISYSKNEILVRLFSHALVSSSAGHESALEKIKEDIKLLKEKSGLK